MTTFRMKSAIGPMALILALGVAACGNGGGGGTEPAAAEEAGHQEGEEEHADDLLTFLKQFGVDL